MRMISSFMDEISLFEGTLNTITFESSEMQMNFSRLFKSYAKNKNMDDCDFIGIKDKAGNLVPSKHWFIIDLDCFSVDLKDEKQTQKLILELLEYQLENDEILLGIYKDYISYTERFVSELFVNNSILDIEFELTDKTIGVFLKSLDVTIEHNEKELVPNFRIRQFIIKTMMKLNLSNKKTLLLLNFPEVGVGFEDYEKEILFLKELGVTTIVQSTNSRYLLAPELEGINLIRKTRDQYDIIGLRDELLTFEFLNKKQIEENSKELAYRDFKRDYNLLDSRFNRFLSSNQH